MGLFSFLKSKPGPIMTEEEHKANLEKQEQETWQTLEALQEAGVQTGQRLRASVHFYTNTLEKALKFKTVLGGLGYFPFHYSPKDFEGRIIMVTAKTPVLPMEKNILGKWTREMCELGFKNDCRLSSWEANPKPTMENPLQVFEAHNITDEQWEKASEKEREALRSVERMPGGLLFARNQVFSSSEDGSIKASFMSGEVKTLVQGKMPFNHLAFNFDQSLVAASSDDGIVYVFEATGFKKVRELQGLDKSGVRKAAFSRKGTIIASTNSGQVGIWNTLSDQAKLFEGHNSPVDALAVHPEKEIAITNDLSGNTLLWDLEQPGPLQKLTEQKGNFVSGIFHYGAHAICWTKDHIIFAADNIEIFDPEFNRIHEIKGLPFAPMAINIVNGRLWAASRYLKAWELGSWKEVFSTQFDHIIYSISHDNKDILFTGHEYGKIMAWDTNEVSGAELEMQHGAEVTHVISNSSYMVTASSDKSIIVWDKTGKPVKRHFGDDRNIAVCCFLSPNEVVFVNNPSVCVLNIDTMQVTRELKLGRYFAFEHCFVQGDELFLSSVSNYPRVVNLRTWTVTEIPFKTALYASSGVNNNRVVYCGYTSIPDESGASFKAPSENHELVQAPLVLVDTASKTVVKEFWLEPENIFAHEDEEADGFYPWCALQENDRVYACYTNGEIARWETATGTCTRSEYVGENGVQWLYKTKAGNLVVVAPGTELVVLGPDLGVKTGIEFEGEVMVKHYDPDNNQVIVYDEDSNDIIFMDADTLAVKGSEAFDGRVYHVHKFQDRYFVFGDAHHRVVNVNR